MSDTISKYWEDNDTFPKDTRKELQRMFDSDPNYQNDGREDGPVLTKTAYRILAEYDEDDIIAAATLLMDQRRRKLYNFRYE